MTSPRATLGTANSPRPETARAPRFPPTGLALGVWGVAAFFYLAAFYLRNSPAVMTTELMRDFGITAVQLGNLSAFYFYAYLLMQIPTGVLVDSWGARRLLVAGSLLAAVGCTVFGTTGTFGLAAGGRAITGAATAVGWVVTLKLATHWFPSSRFATLSGIGLMIGNLGALVAAVPLRVLVEQFGWRSVSVASGLVMLGVGALAWMVIRDDPSARGYQSHAPAALRQTAHIPLWTLLAGFKNIFRYRNTWLIFLAQGGIVGGILSFAGLWGVPFLRLRYGIPVTTAAAICSVMVICFAVGSPASGYLSDRLGARKPIYLGGILTVTIGWSVLFFLPLSIPAFVVFGGLTAFASGANVLAFAYAKESVPAKFLGTISGAINMGNMLGPTLLQPGIGWMLDRQWGGETLEGVRVYTTANYQTAFLLVIGWCILSSVLVSLTRDTHNKQTA
ncbi:MAG: MFS transporter [Vicinamibacterales bacterium]